MVEDKTHIDIETTTVLLSTPFETSPLPEAAEVATEIAAETSTLAETHIAETSTFAETTVPIVTDALLATTEAGLVETAPIVPAVETPSTNDVAVAAPTPDESTHLPEVMLEETTFASTIEPEVTTIVDVMHRKKRSEEAMLTQEKSIADPAPTPFIEEEHKPTPAIEVHPTEKMEIIEDKPALPIEVQPTEMIETIEEGKSAPAIEVHPTEMIETMEDKSTPAIEIHPTEKMEIIEDKPALPIEVHPTEKMETMEEELLTTTLIPEHTEIADLPADDEPSKEEEPKSVEIEEHEIEKEKPAPAIEVDPKEPEEPETFELDAAMKAEAANPARRRFHRFAH
uniref:Zonadhesin n=1 Tax=Plectus sambesii TaxID=2011161 RepID=A0A914XRP9_9BILA